MPELGLGAALVAWYRSEPSRDFGWRDDPSPWGILVAGFLLQHTNGESVREFYDRVLRRYPSPADLADEDPDRLRSMIRPLGLIHRADHMVRCAQEICDRFDGEVPSEEADLLGLFGVGPQRAAAVRCFGFGLPVVQVSVPTERMLRRLFGTGPPAPTAALRDTALSLMPSGSAVEFNYALIDIAGSICGPAEPKCWECPVSNHCESHKGTRRSVSRTELTPRQTQKAPPNTGSQQERIEQLKKENEELWRLVLQLQAEIENSAKPDRR